MSKIRYKAVEISSLGTKEKEMLELADLKKWFDIYYTIHVQKYSRLISLKKDDNGLDPAKELKTLYEEAEVKRTRINDIEIKYNINS